MKIPSVSILVPTYNYACYLPEAIESALEQDYEDFELIIADDASQDDTEEVCRAYEKKDSRIRFVRHEKNLGMVENWNWCLEQARGKYIKFLLADDRFNHPQALRRLVEAFANYPSISMAVSARTLIDENSQNTGRWNPLGAKDRIIEGAELRVKCLEQCLNLIGEPTAVLFKKEDAGRGFDSSFRQLVDLEMWLYLLQSGDLMYFHEPLCCFRQHSAQQTEVNRAGGLHLPELIRLGGYMPEHRKRRMWFRWLYQMKKSGVPVYSEKIASLRKVFSWLTYGISCLEYKLTRPWQNMRKSLYKRIGRSL